tara:strand:+ start:325 stop:543 length:219 start_codon:yes stop_codon:yes gene_type:complete
LGEVVVLPVVTSLDCDPERVLSAAQGKLESVVIMGWDKDGDEYFASSIADGGTCVWLAERLKKKLLEAADYE